MEIKIYSSPTCGYCNQAKDFFRDNNVEFTDLDISSNEQARNELISMGYRGVPVIVIDDEEIVGFDKQRLVEKLNIN